MQITYINRTTKETERIFRMSETESRRCPVTKTPGVPDSEANPYTGIRPTARSAIRRHYKTIKTKRINNQSGLSE